MGGKVQAQPVQTLQVDGVIEKYLSGLEAQPAFQAALQRSLAGYQPSDVFDQLKQDRGRQEVRNMPAVSSAAHELMEATLARVLTAGDLPHAAEAGTEECPHHFSIALCQQCAAPWQHHWLRAQC